MGFRAAGAVSYSATHTGTQNFAVEIPAGIVAGDILILFALKAIKDAVWTTPSGWTAHSALASNRVVADEYNTVVYSKISDGTETTVNVVNNSASTARQKAVCVAYSSPSLSVTPLSAHRLDFANNNTPTVPSIALTTVSDVVVFQNTSNLEVTTAAAPAGYTLRVDSKHDDANIFVADQMGVSSGTHAPGAWLHTVSAAYGDGSTFIVALTPTPTPAITAVDTDNIITQGQQDIVINVANIPAGQVPIRAGAGGTNGVGGTDFTGFSAVAGAAGSFTITCDVPVGIATSTSTQCYVEYAPS